MNSDQQTTNVAGDERESSRRVLTLFDGVCIIVGTIIGAGIFKTPASVAANVWSVEWLVAIWIIGGVVALIGALCFAELTTCYGEAGGDYAYLKRGYSRHLGFAFSWAAFWIIRPGNIGSMAIIFGSFASELLQIAIPVWGYAILGVLALTGLNAIGVYAGKTSQNVLTVIKVVGILLVVAAGVLFWSTGGNRSESKQNPVVINNDVSNSTSEINSESKNVQDLDVSGESKNGVEQGSEKIKSSIAEKSESQNETKLAAENNDAEAKDDGDQKGNPLWGHWNSFWLAMVFVMFTYGGWNDIAFVAAEVRKPRINLFRALILGTTVVILIYLLVNFALVMGLGFERLSSLGFEQNPTRILVSENLGSIGVMLFSILVCVSCLGAINAMIFTSPRIYWATAVDYPRLQWMTGTQDGRGWWRSMLMQAGVTTILILVFGSSKEAFELITVATAPYFWLFLAMTVTSLILCRIKFGSANTGYRVPLYPVLPVVFTAACGFMVYRSWDYMVFKGYWLSTLVIGIWMVVGVGLSFALGKTKEAKAI